MENEDIRFAVYDKNEENIELTVSYITAYFNDKNIPVTIHRFYDTQGLIDAFRHINFTALLMGMDGMDEVDTAWTIKKLAAGCSQIIMSNTGDYSMEGYRLDVFDYWLRPLDQAKINESLERLNITN